MSGFGGKLGGAGIDAFIHGMQVQCVAVFAHFFSLRLKKLRDAFVGEAFAFQTTGGGEIKSCRATCTTCCSSFKVFDLRQNQVDGADFGISPSVKPARMRLPNSIRQLGFAVCGGFPLSDLGLKPHKPVSSRVGLFELS